MISNFSSVLYEHINGLCSDMNFIFSEPTEINNQHLKIEGLKDVLGEVKNPDSPMGINVQVVHIIGISKTPSPRRLGEESVDETSRPRSLDGQQDKNKELISSLYKALCQYALKGTLKFPTIIKHSDRDDIVKQAIARFQKEVSITDEKKGDVINFLYSTILSNPKEKKTPKVELVKKLEPLLVIDTSNLVTETSKEEVLRPAEDGKYVPLSLGEISKARKSTFQLLLEKIGDLFKKKGSKK